MNIIFKKVALQAAVDVRDAQDIAWERWRPEILGHGRRNGANGLVTNEGGGADSAITDDDLNELKRCMELGFSFEQEDGQHFCNTLSALDLYFAVNHQLSPSSVLTRSSFESLHSDSDTWKIFNPSKKDLAIAWVCLIIKAINLL
ncbi:hypothetical protein SAY86_007310 [Trapa natans]|uniref:Uncharacterized protein n=1 Tax=Trapa natans TaxID=22666 RepID=A0AAN7LBF6_TRANT|nr:hypothetical protein SAY86_007310 [Trapa natans]